MAADAAAIKHAVPLTAAQKKANAAHAAKLAAALYASMAPADEYFGPLKLSIIGIQNTIRDIGLRYKYNPTLAAPSYASTQLVESAVRDWAHRYAHDPQLPRNVYFLQRLYTQILLQQSRDRAAVVAKWMAVTFPTSPQERQLKKTLATEHLAPIPSPSPTPSATPMPTETPTEDPFAQLYRSAPPQTPAPSGSNAATPSPAATEETSKPTAEPIPQPAPPSSAPSTASPAPEPAPGASPSAEPSPVPASTQTPQTTR